jgi:hypothetical protein
MPKWQGTISSYWDIRILHVFVVILVFVSNHHNWGGGIAQGEVPGQRQLAFSSK